MAKKLKKAGTVKAPKGVLNHPIEVRFGSGKDMGEWRGYPTESKARQAIVKELNSWMPWCLRHNNDGIIAIDQAKSDVDAMTFHEASQTIVCHFDAYYDVKLVVEYRRKA